MNSVRAKNIVIIILVSIIAVAILAGSIYVAVESNKKYEDTEYFFDTAPVDYSKEENFAYALAFREGVINYLSSYSEEISKAIFSQFADKLLNAMSKSRISAETLGKMATALKKYNAEDIFGADADIDWDNITEEDIEDFFNVSSLDVMSKFLNGFFKESGLTGEEVGTIIFNYLDMYGSDEYKVALYEIGKDNFVNLISFSAYFITSIADIKQGVGNYVNANVLKSAFYELGDTLSDCSEAGVDTLERGLGLKFSYGSDKENYILINSFTAGLDKKIGCLFPLFGYILKNVEATDIENARTFADNEDNNALVASQRGFAKTIKKGIDLFLSEYGEDFGAESYEEFKLQIPDFIKSLYSARMLIAGFDAEILEDELFIEILNNSNASFEKFFVAMDYLNSTENVDEEAINYARDMWALDKESGEIIGCIAYLWTAQRLYGAEKEINIAV